MEELLEIPHVRRYIIDYIGCAKNALLPLIEKENDSIIRIERSLKLYFATLLEMILSTLHTFKWQNMHMDYINLHIPQIDKKKDAHTWCKTILWAINMFMQLIEVYGIPKAEIYETNIDFSQSLSRHLKILDDCFTFKFGFMRNQIDYFTVSFNAEKQEQSSVSELVSAMKIMTEVPVNEFKIESLCKLLRKLWFRLRISRFYSNYMQVYSMEDKPILIVREYYDKPDDTGLYIAQEILEKIKY